MKGIIFNIVEEVVADAYGPAAWDGLMAAAGLDGGYTSLGSYPDSQLYDIVGAACTTTRLAPADLLRMLGRNSMPKLFERYPHLFDSAPDARSFILGLNTIIHPEVRKLYAGASCPHFQFTQGEQRLTLGYNSPRKLCHLAEGFVAGLADHFGETIAISQSTCMHDGDAACHIDLAWS
jgi:hypothetical protein